MCVIKNFFKRVGRTLFPTIDYRFLLLVGVLGAVMSAVDPVGLNAMRFLIFGVIFWGVSLWLRKVLTPYRGVKMSDLARKAMEGCQAAAIIYLANTLLMIAIGISFFIWWR